MIILGLDMATHSSGLALIDENEQLLDHKLIYIGSNSIFDRCKYIYDELDNYLIKYPEITNVGLEDILLNKWVPNLNSCRDLITLKGWVQAVLYKNGLVADLWTPNQWKSYVGIYSGPEGKTRNAQKQRAMKLVKDKYNIEVDDNQADAVCIALSELKWLKESTNE